MKHIQVSVAWFLMALITAPFAWGQSDSTSDSKEPQNPFVKKSKPSDQVKAKADGKDKTSGKDAKENPFKPKAKKSGARDDAEMSDDAKSEEGSEADKSKPKWSVKKIRVAPFPGGKFTTGNVNIEPTKGMLIIEAGFDLEALRPDNQAVELYLRALRANNRREPAPRDRTEYRVLEAKNIALRDANGKKFVALWSVGGAMRTTTINYSISPNAQSQSTHTTGSVDQNGPWLDAEQTFITRVTTPFNQPSITEYAAFFSGILRTEQSSPMRFLFSIPATADIQSLKLVVDSEEFAIGE